MNIFTSLKKVFGTGLMIGDVKGGSIKIIDTQRTQAYSRKNSFMSKLHKNQIYQSSLAQNYSINRLALYRDYDMMDADPLMSSALDVYVFEALTKDEYGKILKIYSEDQQIVQVLQQFFYQRLNCQFNFPVWFRNFVKYGDCFLALKINEQYGIIGTQPISAYDMERVEDDRDNPDEYFFKFTSGGDGLIDNYNIAHFRLLNDTNFLPYGRSTLQPARRIWKNLSLMIDAMMIQRIMRAPERRVFKIDVGNLPDEQVTPYMKDIIGKMTKVPYKDPQNGQINLKYNIQNLLQDFFLPVRGKEDGSSIQTLAGMENTFTEDIEFMKSYMMSALKIPKAFLTFEQGIEAKSTLSSLDIIFSRYIETLQGVFVNELYRIALIHLFVLGYTDIENINFKLQLNNPSNVKKIQEIELWNQLIDLGMRMEQSQHFSLDFIYESIYNIPKEKAKIMLKQIVSDTKYKAGLERILNGEDGKQGQEGYGDYEAGESAEEGGTYEQTTADDSQVADQFNEEHEQAIENTYQETPLTNDFKGNSPLHQ